MSVQPRGSLHSDAAGQLGAFLPRCSLVGGSSSSFIADPLHPGAAPVTPCSTRALCPPGRMHQPCPEPLGTTCSSTQAPGGPSTPSSISEAPWAAPTAAGLRAQPFTSYCPGGAVLGAAAVARHPLPPPAPHGERWALAGLLSPRLQLLEQAAIDFLAQHQFPWCLTSCLCPRQAAGAGWGGCTGQDLLLPICCPGCAEPPVTSGPFPCPRAPAVHHPHAALGPLQEPLGLASSPTEPSDPHAAPASAPKPD